MGVHALHAYTEKHGLFNHGTLSDALKSINTESVITDTPSVFLSSFFSDLLSVKKFIFDHSFFFQLGRSRLKTFNNELLHHKVKNFFVLDGKLDESHPKTPTTKTRHSPRGADRTKVIAKAKLLMWEEKDENDVSEKKSESSYFFFFHSSILTVLNLFFVERERKSLVKQIPLLLRFTDLNDSIKTVIENVIIAPDNTEAEGFALPNTNTIISNDSDAIAHGNHRYWITSVNLHDLTCRWIDMNELSVAIFGREWGSGGRELLRALCCMVKNDFAGNLPERGIEKVASSILSIVSKMPNSTKPLTDVEAVNVIHQATYRMITSDKKMELKVSSHY